MKTTRVALDPTTGSASPRRGLHRATVVALGLAVVTAVVRADPPPGSSPAGPPPVATAPTATAVAEKVVDAVARKDEAALATLAEALDPDPFLVANRLFRRRVDAKGADDPAAKEALTAAAAFASGAARAHPFLEPMPALVARWAALGSDDRSTERRLWGALEAALAAMGRSDQEAIQAALSSVDAEVAAAPWSVTALVLRTMSARSRIEAGEASKALAEYQAVAAGAAAIGWKAREADAVDAEASIAFGRTQFADAAAAFRREVALREAIGDRKRLADAIGNLGQALGSTGQFDQSMAALERSRSLRKDVGDAVGAAKLSADIALAFAERGAYAESLARFASAREEAKAVGATRALALIASNEPLALQGVGRIPEALDGYRAALAAAEAAGDKNRAILLLGNVGAMERLLHYDDQALATLARAEQLAEKAGRTESVADALLNQSAVLRHLWKMDEALPRAERAFQLYESIGSAKATLALADLGAILQSLGRLEESLARLGEAGQRAAARGDVVGVAQAAVGTAIAKYRSGAPDAIAALSDALEREKDVGSPFQVAFVLRWRMDALVHADRYDEAVSDAEMAVDLLVRAGADFGEGEEAYATDELYGSAMVALSAASTLALRASLSSDAEARARKSRAQAAAFRAMEAMRGLRVAQALGNAKSLLASHASPEAIAAREEARRGLARAQAARRRAAAEKSDDFPSIRRARADVDAAYAVLEESGARLHREAARAAEWAIPRPIALDAARSLLPPRTALVEYVVGEALYGAMVLRSDGADLVILGETEPVAADLAAYLDTVTSGDAQDDSTEERLAESLYLQLFAPLEAKLGDADRLIIAPDGPLCFFPFEALVRARDAGAQRLVERLEVTYVPSATVLQGLGASATPGRADLLAVGDPVYPSESPREPIAPAEPSRGSSRESGAGGGTQSPSPCEPGPPSMRPVRGPDLRGIETLSRLPGTGDEVRSIASLFPEGHATVLVRERASLDATLAAIGRGVPRASLHIACHGYLDDARPRLCGLVLSGGDVLTVDRVGDLDLSAMNLVVLSACETAKGRERRGEGVIGLVRAFFLAGAPRVVASNWKVSDASTKTLMTAFYEGMRRDGLAPAAALRRAKIAMLRSGGERAHPYHWAPFALWGRSD